MSKLVEYIWIDGTKPTPLLRSKTKVVSDSARPPVWGFDGSSTQQAPGDQSDCVLQPVFVCPDPIRGGDNLLALCEVETTDGQPHVSNTRSACVAVEKEHLAREMWFGLEQEYTLYKPDGRPLGFPQGGYPGVQGPYYCGVGADLIYGREIAEEHLEACLAAGLGLSGINAEVMPGQWEFQVGPLGPVAVGDHLTVARWLLQRISEKYDVRVSFDPKPVSGDWNGAGCHANFSTKEMRESYQACVEAAEALQEKHQLHIDNYGVDNDKRLTGLHETCPITEFKYGPSDRGASVRIPWQVERDQKGYIEDRRPAANCDPYTVARLITDTVCK